MRILPSVALATLLLVATLIAQSRIGHTLLQVAGLTETPRSYTALSFTNPQALPTSVPSGRFVLLIPFSVYNASEAAQTYRWSILLGTAKGTRSIATGHIEVPQGSTEN